VFAISVQPTSGKATSSVSLPTEYQEFADIFDKEKASRLPEHRPYDCPIDLVEGKQPPFGPIYSLSPSELETLRQYIDENLANGFIRHSRSPAGAPVFFVSKKDGALRMVVDYRGLNKITVPNRYPLPLIHEMLERLSGAKYFTKIDLRGAYNLVRIRPGDEWKTAFRTRYGHFEYTVMPFGLTNAPAVFQHMANDVFRDFLDLFVIIYLDDILVYSKTLEEHQQHVRQVLQRLREYGLYAKLEKCQFHQEQVEFLGYVVSSEGISMDPAKIRTILEWESPRSVRDVQCFLGFANFYRKFIDGYSKLALPLIRLTRKDIPFKWGIEAENAFTALKHAFTVAPILVHPDPAKAYIMEADASDFALGSILSQYGEDGQLHPVAFHSRKFRAPEINYEIHDKELLAIKDSFDEWRHFLEGSPHQTIVYTDHKNLEYFQTAQSLSRRQMRWAQDLAKFNFVIKYRPGLQQGKPDALSRRSYMAPREGDLAYDQQRHVLLGPDKLQLFASEVYTAPQGTLFFDNVRVALSSDELANDVRQHLQASSISGKSSRSDYDHFEDRGGLLFRDGLLYVPAGSMRVEVLQQHHDTPLAGHFGITKTVELITRNYWWPQLRHSVEEFVRTCDTCNRAKTPRHLPYGLLQPLPIPSKPWESISMDFITDLPSSHGFDALLVVVDRFSKMAHFSPCTKSISSEETAQILLRDVFRLHGFPDNIISDRGPQFIAKFWQRLLELLQIQRALSSGYHPQTDGQTERTIQTLEQYLRCFISYQQDDWVDLLPMAEFAYNNSSHASTGSSPFFVITGSHPRWTFLGSKSDSVNPTAEARGEHIQRIHAEVNHHLHRAQESHKRAADRHRQTPPTFNIGDRVWLLRRHFSTSRPCDKFDYQRVGPFSISARINDVAYRLELPPTMKVHPTFHVSLLEPYHENTLPGRVIPPPPPIEVDNHPEYEVAEILDSKLIRGHVHYLVDWVGYPPSERTWEPASNVTHAPDKVNEFHRRYPNKPRASSRRRPLRRR
jgi:transposase InsO family protein